MNNRYYWLHWWYHAFHNTYAEIQILLDYTPLGVTILTKLCRRDRSKQTSFDMKEMEP